MRRVNALDQQQQAIFGPFFAMIVLTIGVWVLMFVRRIRFIRGNKIQPEQLLRPGELARISPAPVANVSDNLKNLFEIPVIFYVFSLYLYVTRQVDTTYVITGWIYFVFRVCHSAIHCTVNAISPRFYSYLLSCIALYSMLFRAMLSHFFS